MSTLDVFCSLIVTTSAPVFGLIAVCVPKLAIAAPRRDLLASDNEEGMDEGIVS